MGSSPKQKVGDAYFVGLHMLMGVGIFDRVRVITYDDRPAWVGANEGGYRIVINQPELLGAADREGGIAGEVDFETGAPDQGVNGYLQSAIGGLMPAFRYVGGLVFRRPYMGNSNSLRKIGVMAECIDVQSDGTMQWYPETSRIPSTSYVSDLRTTLTVGPGTLPNGPGQPLSLYDLNRPTQPYEFCFFGAGSVTNTETDEDGNYTFQVDAGVIDTGFAFFYADLRQLFGSSGEYSNLEVRVTGEVRQTASSQVNVREGVGCFYKEALEGSTHYYDDLESEGGIPGNFVGTGAIYDWTPVDSDWQTIPDGQRYIRPYLSFGRFGEGRNLVCQIRGNFDTQVFDANPAHMTRECLRMVGNGDADFDDVSFRAAADLFYSESLGLSGWLENPNDEAEVLSFIQKLKEHAEFELYQDTTGLFVIKPIRDDYDVNTIPVVEEAEHVISHSLSVEDPGEIPNSVSLNYISNQTQGTVTIKAANTAAVLANEGRENPATPLERPFINREDLANQALEAALAFATVPKFRGEITISRKAGVFNKGDVFLLNVPSIGVAGKVFRVHDRAEGTPTDRRLSYTISEDRYRLGRPGLVGEDDTGWVDPIQPAQEAEPRLVEEATYYSLVRDLGDNDVITLLEREPDSGVLYTAAGYGFGASFGARIHVDAGSGYEETQFMGFSSFGYTASVTSRDPEDVEILLNATSGLDLVETGTLASLGGEFVRVVSINDLTVTVARGVNDTVPAEHPIGTPIIFVDDLVGTDGVERIAGEALNVRLLPRTGRGTLALSDAPTDSVTLNSRAIRPYPPGRLALDGDFFPSETLRVSTGSLTWVARNNSLQTTATPVAFLDAFVTDDPDVTYQVRIHGVDQSRNRIDPPFIDVNVGAAKTYAYDSSTWVIPAGTTFIDFEVVSIKDGYESWTSPYARVASPFISPLAISVESALGRPIISAPLTLREINVQSSIGSFGVRSAVQLSPIDVQADLGGLLLGEQLLLDGITIPADASAGAMFRLRSVYNGPVVRLQRSSDGTEQDYFLDSNGDLPIANIEAWRNGSATIYVRTIYDQTGNGLNITARTTSNSFHPTFYRSGAYETIDGGIYAWSHLPGSSFSAAARAMLHQFPARTSSAQMFILADMLTDGAGALIGAEPTSGNTAIYGGAWDSTTLSVVFNNLGDNAQGYINNILVPNSRVEWQSRISGQGKIAVALERMDLALLPETLVRPGQYSDNGAFKTVGKVGFSGFFPTPLSAADSEVVRLRLNNL